MTTRLRRSLRAIRTPLLAAVAIVALTVAVAGFYKLGDQAIQRHDAERAASLAACERGNDLRQQIIDLGEANDVMITTILDMTFQTTGGSPERAAAIEALRRRLDAPIAKYRATVDAIELTDCQDATPGAKENS